MLEWRKFHKIKTTYTNALLRQKDSKTNKIHTIFSQVKTNTGRLNSIHPNLQNIPIKTTEGNIIRSAFISSPGYKLLSADYSQMELRLLSHIGNIKPMQEAFKKNIDIHSETASQIFNTDINEVTMQQRNKAKNINFGIIYGITNFGLAKQIKTSPQEAQKYIEKYMQKYCGIHDYMDRIKDFAQRNGYVESLFGRRCSIININAKERKIRQWAERMAINAPIQSSAADIMRIAMIQVQNKLEKNKLDCKMLLQIHDELLFECREENLDKAKDIIKNVMQNVIILNVPITVNVLTGNNWYMK